MSTSGMSRRRELQFDVAQYQSVVSLKLAAKRPAVSEVFAFSPIDKNVVDSIFGAAVRTVPGNFVAAAAREPCVSRRDVMACSKVN